MPIIITLIFATFTFLGFALGWNVRPEKIKVIPEVQRQVITEQVEVCSADKITTEDNGDCGGKLNNCWHEYGLLENENKKLNEKMLVKCEVASVVLETQDKLNNCLTTIELKDQQIKELDNSLLICMKQKVE